MAFEQEFIFSGDADTGGDCYDTWIGVNQLNGGYMFGGELINYGGLTWFGANEPASARGLLRFDVSSLAGQFNEVISIELRLYQTDGLADVNVAAYEISDANSNWQEGVDIGSLSSFGGYWNRTTWATKLRDLTDESWAGAPGLTTAGIDYDPIPLVTTTSSGGGWMSFHFTGDLMGLMDDWVLSSSQDTVIYGLNIGNFADPEEFTVVDNPGLLLIADGLVQWSSGEGDFSPELIVTIPEPATMSLLALGACLPLFRRKRRQGLTMLRRRKQR